MKTLNSIFVGFFVAGGAFGSGSMSADVTSASLIAPKIIKPKEKTDKSEMKEYKNLSHSCVCAATAPSLMMIGWGQSRAVNRTICSAILVHVSVCRWSRT